MSEYANHLEIKVADMVYLNFGAQLDGNTVMVSKVVMNVNTLKALNETISKVLFDIEAKQAESNKSKAN